MQWSLEGVDPGVALLAILVFGAGRVIEWALRVAIERGKQPVPPAEIDSAQLNRIEQEVDAMHGVVLYKTPDGNYRIFGDPVLKHEVEQARNTTTANNERLKDLATRLEDVKDALNRLDDRSTMRMDVIQNKLQDVGNRLEQHDIWERKVKHGPH